MSKETISFVSLGCPKNQVDAEIMCAKLAENYELTDEPMDSDLVIINTCGFIESAKQEAIDNILAMAELKEDGYLGKIVVTGCLAQRYNKEISEEIPEVDAVIGLGANGDIVSIVEKVLDGEAIEEFPSKLDLPLSGERILETPEHWAYLKIAEGCSNACAYCAIPMIRGKFRSRTMESVIEEAERLVENGARELVVIAQDTTRYGEDIYGELKLPELLTKLSKIEDLKWLRLMYCYPDRITDELLDVMATNEKVLPYIDLPLQHCNEHILKAMNRTGSRAELTALIQKIRNKVKGIVIRTTLITGFPGEGEAEFEELSEFINEIEFDRLGCFAYSAEEGTPAATFPNQVDNETKQHRSELIMQDQYGIVECKNLESVGKTFEVMVEGYDGYSDSFYGRSYAQAPEIDPVIFFTTAKGYDDGDFVKVEIMDVSGDDLIGKAIEA